MYQKKQKDYVYYMLYNIYNLILFKSSNISKLYCTFEIFIIASAVDVKKSKNALLSEREKKQS